MATLSPPPNSSNLLFFLLASVLLISAASALEFRVGGTSGWTEPTGNESETYNHWAGRHRFHIGDTLYFKYENDSVLVVGFEDYGRCNTASPLVKFTDGNSTFEFNRHGFFYFISGNPEHCRAGQKLIVRVMVHPRFVSASPGPAPSPQQDGGWVPGSGSGSDHSGSKQSSGSLKVNVDSHVIVARIVGLFVASMFV